MSSSTDYTLPTDADGNTCDQEYFVDLVNRLVKSVFVLQTLAVGLIGYAFASYPDFREAFNLLYNFLTDFSGGIGYLTSAAFFLAMEYNFGPQMCTAGGYIMMATGYVETAINFLTQAQDAGLF